MNSGSKYLGETLYFVNYGKNMGKTLRKLSTKIHDPSIIIGPPTARKTALEVDYPRTSLHSWILGFLFLTSTQIQADAKPEKKTRKNNRYIRSLAGGYNLSRTRSSERPVWNPHSGGSPGVLGPLAGRRGPCHLPTYGTISPHWLVAKYPRIGKGAPIMV